MGGDTGVVMLEVLAEAGVYLSDRDTGSVVGVFGMTVRPLRLKLEEQRVEILDLRGALNRANGERDSLRVELRGQVWHGVGAGKCG